jgi:DNA-binding NarL/FixJ family response regulator
MGRCIRKMIKIVIIAEPVWEENYLKKYLSSQRDFKILGFGKDDYDALKLVNTFKPDIVLIDIYRNDINGVEIAPLLRSKSPSTRVIILSSFEDEEHISKVLSNQISGYLLRNGDYEKIAESIRTIYRGGIFYAPRIASKVFELISKLLKKDNINYRQPLRNKTAIPSTISGMELRIMVFIGKGRSDKEIAENLSLKPGTVRNYISSAMHKAGLRNRTEIAIYAFKNGLIDPP